MVTRIGDMELEIDFNHLKDLPKQIVFSGDICENIKQAKVTTLQRRLRGINAHAQNSYNGVYEIMQAEVKPQMRKLDANFRELGAGVYEAMSPEWDAGSMWTVYSNQDGTIILSKLEENELTHLGDNKSLIRESNINEPTMAVKAHYGKGTQLTYRKGTETHRGVVVGYDGSMGAYAVQNELTKDIDYIPSELNNEGALEDELQKHPHNESAYSSEDPQAAYNYEQQSQETMGNEQYGPEFSNSYVASCSVSELYSKFRHAFDSREFPKFKALVSAVIGSNHHAGESLLVDVAEDFPVYFCRAMDEMAPGAKDFSDADENQHPDFLDQDLSNLDNV